MTSTIEKAVVSDGRAGVPKWGDAFASHPGFLRENNQDAGVVFREGEFQVAIVADGLGGLPHGAEASAIAVDAAAKALKGILTESYTDEDMGLEAAMGKAFDAAEKRLKRTAGAEADGYRTTLIILIGSEEKWVVGWIGDGGCTILKALGATIEAVSPHKDPGTPWLLLRSLGPERHGIWEAAAFKRDRGDIVIIGTDGLVDGPLPEGWQEAVRTAVIEADGDVQGVAERLVTELAEAKDEHGYLFNDNVSVAIVLGDGGKPVGS